MTWTDIWSQAVPYFRDAGVGLAGALLTYLRERQKSAKAAVEHAQELSFKTQQLADARDAKAAELLQERDRLIYGELKSYCDRLQGRVDRLEAQQEISRLSTEQAVATAHLKDLEMTQINTRLSIIQSRCNNACGLMGIILPPTSVSP